MTYIFISYEHYVKGIFTFSSIFQLHLLLHSITL